MDLLQLAAMLIGFLMAWVGLETLKTKRNSKREERHAAASAALEAELRKDIEDGVVAQSKSLFRIDKLEEQRTSDLALIDKLTGQVGTLLSQMDLMQKAFDTLQEKFDGERRENERLSTENKRLEKQNADLFESNKLLKNDNKTMREMVALLGLKLTDDKPDPPGPKAPKSMPLARIA